MSGPALRQRDAHAAIHEAAAGQLAEWLDAFAASESSSVRWLWMRRFVQDFEARVLRHAEEEELDLYPEWRKVGDAVIADDVEELVREHRHLAAAVAHLREWPDAESPAAGILMKELLQSLHAHETHEEAVLDAVLAARGGREAS